MAAKDKRHTNKPRGNAGKNSGSEAGKRSEQKAGAAAHTAPPKAPATAALTAAAKMFEINGSKSKLSSGTNPQSQSSERKSKESNVGKVYRGRTKYIDVETKPERNYVVVVDDGKNVSVAKMKSIKIFDADGKNADKALVEINATRYGLEKRTGVDFQVFGKNRMSGKPLKIEDKEVFPENKERFKLGSHDLNRTLVHTGRALRGKKKRGK